MGDDQRRELAELRKFAEAHPLDIRKLHDILKTQIPPGDEPGRSICLPIGFRVVFTIEQHPESWMRHLSVSVDGKRGAVPNNFAMAWIARQLGFTDQPSMAFLENEREPHPAVNWMQKTAAPGEGG